MKNLVNSFLILIPAFCIAEDSLNISLIYHWEDTTLPVSIAHGNAYNDVWGFTQNDREYAVIGSTLGAHFFDVTDPGNATQVDFVPGALQGPAVVHRDYHDYQNYLYMVCDEGPSTLQIVNLSYLPDSVHLVYDSDDLLNVSHNVFIDSATAKMYVCGGANQLAVYSLADPTHPIELVNCLVDVSFWASTVGYVHDIYVRNDTAYCNAGPNGLWVVDFSNTANPQLLGSLSQYLQSGYNHSGWLNGAGNYYAIADETHGLDVKMVDVTDLQDMQVVDTFGTNIDPLSIPHNLIFKGDYLFVTYYHDGFYIFNTCNPHNVTTAGYYDTSTEPHNTNFKGAWGVYPFLPSGNILVSDMQNGLFIFDVSKSIISIEHAKVDVTCNGESNGTASIKIENGNGGYDYSWNTGTPQSDSIADQLAAGTYTVTITDANSCEFESTVAINEPSPIIINIQSSDVTTMNGDDGYAVVEVSGGIPGYEIEWSAGTASAVGDSTFNLQAGIYSVTVTDSLGCTQIDTFLISEPVTIGKVPLIKNVFTQPNPFTDRFSLFVPKVVPGDYYEITDVSGLAFLHGEIKDRKTNVRLNGIPSGVYLLKVFLGGTIHSTKIVKAN